MSSELGSDNASTHRNTEELRMETGVPIMK